MATIAVQSAGSVANKKDDFWTQQTWTPLANGDAGAAIEFPDFTDRSIQVTGTFGAGGTVVFEGSNDGANWFTLHDALGVSISFTAAGIKQVTESTRYSRPRVTAGDGTTAITAILFAKRG